MVKAYRGLFLAAGVLVTVGMMGMGQVQHATGAVAPRAHRRTTPQPRWGTQSLSSIADQLAREAHDASPRSAWYFVSTRGPANQATSGATVDGPTLPVYVVIVRGHFSNPKWAMEPLGAPPLMGNTLEFLVNQKTGAVLDLGLVNEAGRAFRAMIGRLGGTGAEHPLPLRGIRTP